MASFCASLVWRILGASTKSGTYVNVPSAHLVDPIVDAYRHWKRFLRGEIHSPGNFELHLLPLNTVGVEEDMLSYVEWVVETKVMGSRTRGDFWVFAKLMGVVIVGIISDPDPQEWRHTKIHAGHGVWDGNMEFWFPEFVEVHMKDAARSGADLAAGRRSEQR